jgi:hypothetical protein
MRRTILGWLIIIHSLAHAFVGEWAEGHGAVWPATVIWSIAAGGYLFAGLGLLRAPGFRRWWKPAMLLATIASFVLVIRYLPFWGLPGTVIDVVLLVATLDVFDIGIDADIAAAQPHAMETLHHPRWVRAGWTFGTAWFIYAVVVMLGRPVSLQWGSTSLERKMPLPGDEVQPADASYRIDHAITIHAPAAAIWPWLLQLGQDRGGFYSYDWLERAIGDSVHNVDRIHPEWQQRAVGDTILAVQRSYAGGRFGTVGWRVNVLQPNRVIGLERWGTFVLQPIDSSTTRLIVRTRGAQRPVFSAFLLAPIDVYVFEPAHFIMERRMLRGIRHRVERGAALAESMVR